MFDQHHSAVRFGNIRLEQEREESQFMNHVTPGSQSPDQLLCVVVPLHNGEAW